MHSIFKLLLIIVFPLHGTGTQFLVLPSSAEEMAIGSHPTFLRFNQINPALIHAPIHSPSLSIGLGNWIGGVTLSHLEYDQSLKGKTVHFGLKYSGLSDLEFRGPVPQDNALAHFSSYGVAIDAGISFKRLNHQLGLSFSIISLGLYDRLSSGTRINFGYLKTLINVLKFGSSILNLGKMSILVSESPALPFRAIAGLSKKLSFNNYHNTVFLSTEWNQYASSYKLSLGNYFKWEKLRLMSGFSLSENVVETSVGMGIHFNKYQINYGILFGSQNLGTPQTLTFHFMLP
jgi:hypothetical protein